MELRQLRAFVTVAEELHFGRAAARLHLSQPALSRQIAALERFVGCALLDRSTHHVALTAAGTVLLDHARGIVADVEHAVAATREAARDGDGPPSSWEQALAVAVESGTGLDELRHAYEGILAGFPQPMHASVTPLLAGGVPGLAVGPAGQRPAGLYLHGGGYVMGSAYGYRSLAGAVALALATALAVPDYRLAPEHPYPAALDDALAVHRWLVERQEPDDLVLVGDSAGAGLALGLLLSLRELDLPMPGRVVLLCPWIDPRPAAYRDRHAPATHWARSFAEQHSAVVDLDTAANPLVADLGGLPPMLVQVGTGDSAFDQSVDLVRRIRACGGTAALETFPVSTHVFHHCWSFLPAAHEALDRIGRPWADRADALTS